MPAPSDVLFGRIAVKNKLVTEAKVKEALALCTRPEHAGKSLAEVLVARGILSAAQKQAIETHMEKLSRNGTEGGKAPGGKKTGGENGESETLRAKDLAERDYSHLAGKPLDLYLREARRVGASDFHFQVDSPPFMRLHGEIVYLKHPVLRPEDTLPAALAVLNDFEKETFLKHNDLDFCLDAEHGRYRASISRQRKGVDSVFRVIPGKVPTVEELHLPQVIKKFTEHRYGLVLITGPAGCGKTATMASLINIVNQKQHDHIVIVEDPIEYIVESRNCNVSQRQVKVHTNSFVAALRSALRADPDYICVGEMRDLETVSMAITAAETGHLVFATLHTTNAVRSIDRIIDVFPPKEQDQIRSMVSESIRGVISQQLLPRADGLGREPACEIMFTSPAVANLVRERKTYQLPSVLQTGSKQGMITMDDAIADLVHRKLVTKETAAYYAESPERFR
jgi:twitching motility protein PilT